MNRVGLFVMPFLSLYLTVERGYSATSAGLMVSLYGFGGILGSLAGGSLADRWGRRPTMLTGQLGAAACTVGLGLADRLDLIALWAAALGVTLKMSQPAVGAMLADLVPPEAGRGPTRSTTGPSTWASRSRRSPRAQSPPSAT
ncbi:MFS transporter [Kitasatospora aburaviensis]